MAEDRRTAEQTATRAAGVGFAGFVARNSAAAYRYAVMLLDDPVAAQDAVHDSLMATWTAASQWPPHALDAAFGRRFVGACRTALKAEPGTGSRADAGAADGGSAELAGALASLDPDDRLLLAERFGMPEHIEPVAITLRGRGSLDRRVPRVLETLAARLPARDVRFGGRDDLVSRLRALYAERDPGDAPTQLRWRLQRSLTESERAAAEQAEIAAAGDWAFPVKTVLVILVFVLTIALASVVRLNANQTAASLGPTPPQTVSIAGLSVVSSGIDGSSVHVAAAPGGFFASFEASSQWHVAPQQCRADVVGTVDGAGTAHWLGEQTAHFARVAADSASGALFATGTGAFCESGGYTSTDGGRTWLARALPTADAAAPDWIALDPTRPGHQLLASAARLYVSTDARAGWRSLPLHGTPVAVDGSGRIVAWAAGRLIGSRDEGSTWADLGPGPALPPVAAAALPDGAYLATPDGLWWCRYGVAPELVHAGKAFSVATTGSVAGSSAIALGSGEGGAAWLVVSGPDGIRDVPLPAEVAALRIAGGQVAAGADGALVAFAGPKSAIVYAAFAR